MSVAQVRVSKVSKYVCDNCSKVEEAEAFPKDWIEFSATENDSLRLFEQVQRFRYESFHIPKQKQVQFCHPVCARTYLLKSVELFLTELAPVKKPSRFTELK